MKTILIALALIALPLTAHAGKLVPPSPEALAPVGNNEDIAATSLAPAEHRTPVYPLSANGDTNGDRIMTPHDSGPVIHTTAPVPGNQSGNGYFATRFND